MRNRQTWVNLQDAGTWELAPAGGLTTEARSPFKGIDPLVQVLRELEEEANIARLTKKAVSDTGGHRSRNAVLGFFDGKPGAWLAAGLLQRAK